MGDVATETPHRGSSHQGRLWQTGRFGRSYDELGPCLGSGGMGSVWAARKSGDSGSGGNWVAVKTMPMLLSGGTDDVCSLHEGLRECLSTFRDLSPAHVVSYDTYWVEEPHGLPAEMLEVCEARLGHRVRETGAMQPLPSQQVSVGHRHSSESTCSLRFLRDKTEGAGLRGHLATTAIEEVALSWASWGSECGPTPTGEFPLTPTVGPADSCGFAWESASVSALTGGGVAHSSRTALANTEAHFDARTPRATPALRGGSAARWSLQARCGADAEVHNGSPPPRCAVLMIEMELMGPIPQGALQAQCPVDDGQRKQTRMTLRAWLQQHNRTLSGAADVIGALMMSVRHIHRKRIVHADLKPDNLFCTEERKSPECRGRVTSVRIGDFGLAGENQQGRQFRYGVFRGSRITGGTPGYVAPETVLAERDRDLQVCTSEKVDIFACAVILLELLLTPFRTQMERVRTLDAFRNEQGADKLPGFVARRLPKTSQLLLDMAAHDPAVRLSAEEVCKRIDKDVKKELCRSSKQLLCQLSSELVASGPAAREPSAARDDGSDGFPAPGPRSRKRKGRKLGRRGC